MTLSKEVGARECPGPGMKNLKPKYASSGGPYSLAGVTRGVH